MRSYAVRYARNHGADDDGEEDAEGEMKAAAAMMHSDVYGLLLLFQGSARSRDLGV